jgi:hypothetical protein
MKLSHSEQRLLKKIKTAGGLLDAEIDKEIFPTFVMRSLMKKDLVHRNTLGMHVVTSQVTEWTNARCEYNEFNQWMVEG